MEFSLRQKADTGPRIRMRRLIVESRAIVWVSRVLFLALLPGLEWSSALAQNTVGTVSDVAGVAHVERAGTTLPVTAGMPVDLKDKFTTDTGANLTITLNDNSRLSLSEQRTMVLDEQVLAAGGGNTRVSLLGGHLESLVTKALRGAAPRYEVLSLIKTRYASQRLEFCRWAP